MQHVADGHGIAMLRCTAVLMELITGLGGLLRVISNQSRGPE
jgi:hypothetical protein